MTARTTVLLGLAIGLGCVFGVTAGAEEAQSPAPQAQPSLAEDVMRAYATAFHMAETLEVARGITKQISDVLDPADPSVAFGQVMAADEVMSSALQSLGALEYQLNELVTRAAPDAGAHAAAVRLVSALEQVAQHGATLQSQAQALERRLNRLAISQNNPQWEAVMSMSQLPTDAFEETNLAAIRDRASTLEEKTTP